MKKSDLSRQLNDLGEWEENPFKKRAYIKAAAIIADMDEDEFTARTDFRDIDGIGEALNQKILQFKQTGTIEKWQQLTRERTGGSNN
jgi:DNA polymerase/3'-5' exonuclease PolX